MGKCVLGKRPALRVGVDVHLVTRQLTVPMKNGGQCQDNQSSQPLAAPLSNRAGLASTGPEKFPRSFWGAAWGLLGFAGIRWHTSGARRLAASAGLISGAGLAVTPAGTVPSGPRWCVHDKACRWLADALLLTVWSSATASLWHPLWLAAAISASVWLSRLNSAKHGLEKAPTQWLVCTSLHITAHHLTPSCMRCGVKRTALAPLRWTFDGRGSMSPASSLLFCSSKNDLLVQRCESCSISNPHLDGAKTCTLTGF